MRVDYTPEQIDSFWSTVDRSGGPDACWPCTGGHNVAGYRRIGVEYAHRIAYVLTYGDFPNDKPNALHKCDTRPCCNPAHLFAGSHADNVQDRIAKGRSVYVRGDKVGCAVLTEEVVREARRMYRRGKRGCGVPSIAKALGVKRRTLYAAIFRESWQHVD